MCGVEIRSETDADLIEQVQAHALDAHQISLSEEQVRSMMEIEQ